MIMTAELLLSYFFMFFARSINFFCFRISCFALCFLFYQRKQPNSWSVGRQPYSCMVFLIFFTNAYIKHVRMFMKIIHIIGLNSFSFPSSFRYTLSFGYCAPVHCLFSTSSCIRMRTSPKSGRTYRMNYGEDVSTAITYEALFLIYEKMKKQKKKNRKVRFTIKPRGERKLFLFYSSLPLDECTYCVTCTVYTGRQ